MEVLINIDVDDLEKAERFYCSAFGLTAARRFGGVALELRGHASPIYLLQQPEGSPAGGTTGQVRRYARHWTPVHLDFVVEDIESAVQSALAAGATLEKPAAVHRWGKLAVLADPFGNGFCFLEFLGRGYDEIAD